MTRFDETTHLIVLEQLAQVAPVQVIALLGVAAQTGEQEPGEKEVAHAQRNLHAAPYGD